jgi:hypothetical protein
MVIGLWLWKPLRVRRRMLTRSRLLTAQSRSSPLPLLTRSSIFYALNCAAPARAPFVVLPHVSSCVLSAVLLAASEGQ